MTTMLKVDAVTRLFGGFKAVDGVSLQLKAGEILGIAGTNGAGKSTLFAAIAGQQPADAGQIEFDGQDITRIAFRRSAVKASTSARAAVSSSARNATVGPLPDTIPASAPWVSPNSRTSPSSGLS